MGMDVLWRHPLAVLAKVSMIGLVSVGGLPDKAEAVQLAPVVPVAERSVPADLVGTWAFSVATGNYCNPLGHCAPGSGGSMSCAAGPGGGGCFGCAWWQDDSKYEASVWDLDGLEKTGTVSADVSGTSYIPAIIIPIPLIARTQSKACNALANQLKLFIVSDESV